MNYHLSKTNDTYHLRITKTIHLNPLKLWPFLSMTEGFAQWFPEIKADNLPQTQLLIFEMEGFKEELPLINYQSEHFISFEWATGQVHFQLKQLSESETELTFNEELPSYFPNISQDFAGWLYQIEHLSAVAEKSAFLLSKADIPLLKKEIEAKLAIS